MTPGTGAAGTKVTSFTPLGSRLTNFADASQQLTGVFPFQLDKFEQVSQNSYNWQGPTDCSVACQMGFTPDAVVVSGTVLDDQPLLQLHNRPDKPAWWRIAYGADGLEFRVQDMTSETQVLHFALNFSSGGFNPQVQLLQSPGTSRSGFVETATLELGELETPGGVATSERPKGFRFRAVLPSAGIAEPKFFTGALRISVKAHDLDGDFGTYTTMEEIVEKAP